MYSLEYQKELQNQMKNLMGQEVLHTRFGKGIIREVDDDYIHVDFEGHPSKFVNDERFFSFCEVQNQDLTERILQSIEELHRKDTEAHRLYLLQMEEEAKKKALEKKASEMVKKTKKKTRKTK